MAEALEPVSQAIANSKFAAIAPYVRDEHYDLRDLRALGRRSLLWTLFGLLISIIGLGGAAAVLFTATGAEDVGAGALIFLIPCIALYLLLFGAFVRMRSFSGHFPELAAFDSRKPILYLRNFAAENPDLAHDSGLPIGMKVSFEHFIGTFFWEYGRVVALGDPQQRRPAGSVSRFFVTDEGWQASVQTAMAAAQANIIHYGAGANVDWEVDQAEAQAQTPRLLIMNVRRDGNQRRVADLASPNALRAAFTSSKVKLPAGPDLMIGAIRDRKGEAIMVVTPDSQGLAKLLNKFKRGLGKGEKETLPPQIKKLRDQLHNASYRPVLVALPGLCALLLLLAAAWLAPGLWA